MLGYKRPSHDTWSYSVCSCYHENELGDETWSCFENPARQDFKTLIDLREQQLGRLVSFINSKRQSIAKIKKSFTQKAERFSICHFRP